MESDVVAAMNFLHLLKVARRDPALSRQLGLDEPDDVSRKLPKLNVHRLLVAHPNKPILESPEEIGNLMRTDGQIHELVQRLTPIGSADQ